MDCSFSELTATRRSCRAFVPGAAPTREELTAIVKAAQLSPSWKNSQTARYYAALSPESVQAVYDLLPDFNKTSTAGVGAYVLVTFVKGISGFNAAGQPCIVENGDEWGAYDLGLANAYFVLAAKNAGYDTLIMGLHDAAGMRKLFGVPDNEEVMAVIAVGKAAGTPALRPRKTVGEILTVK